nr:MAG TPA: hypothetical protein [Caudoviricetes sp.]
MSSTSFFKKLIIGVHSPIFSLNFLRICACAKHLYILSPFFSQLVSLYQSIESIN